MKLLIRYFVRGSLVSVPLFVTVYIVYLVVSTIDGFFDVRVPGLGIIITFSLVTLVGFLTSNVIGGSLLEAAERFFKKLPLVKLLYSSIKDLVSAFVGSNKRFDQPVLLRLGHEGRAHVLGFVTRASLNALHMPDHVAVYVPQSYNFAGNLLVAPRELVEPLDVGSADVMTFIVSGGVSGLGVGQSLPPPPPTAT